MRMKVEIAREERMPPYIIFSDKTLIDMCVVAPKNKNEMLNVSGVGANEYESIQSSNLKRKKKGKDEFYLNEADAEKFRYADLYYISDIKEELNRVCSISGVKKVTMTKNWKYLVSMIINGKI